MSSLNSLLLLFILMYCTAFYVKGEAKHNAHVVGQRQHRALPDEFLNIDYLHGEREKSIKNSVKRTHNEYVRREKYASQRKYFKKDERPQIKHSQTRDNHLDQTIPGMKRTPATVTSIARKAFANKKVQEAVVEKGIEVVGNAIDKHQENVERAQKKSDAFLNQRIRLDISPEKGWENEDMFVPPGYHIGAEIENENSSSGNKEQGEPVFTYPSGIGTMMMNGCWGTKYQPGDPCYQSIEALSACQNMIDGAAFIGVGFDGRGKYSPESRKMSIIQRSCGGRSYYDDFQVPDTMNVHGIYETSSSMRVFSSRREYQSYLQTESGVSGSFFGFHAGVKAAYGSSFNSNQQTNLAVFDIDVDRYEIFKDEVKPQDLSRAFLHEFMYLPESYFQPGAPTKFNDFISRWGTHYIKSAKFGGQLQIRKLQSGRSISTKAEFAVEAEAEYRGLFASGGGYSSSKGGSQQKTETKFMSTSVQALGGSQRIAAAVADVYTPIFKNTLLDWLDSINDYPKAFKFIMGSITDLVDFRAIDLFPDENVDWGCEANSHNLVEEGNTGRYYYGDTNKTFCEYRSRSEIEFKLKQRRSSLKTAIQAYMEEGPVSATDISIRAGEGGCETQDLEDSLAIPNWDDITKQEETFHVIFDMDNELRGRNNIPKTMSRSVKLRDNTWFTASENGEFHLYSGFNNAGSPTPSNKKISIFGLVLTLDETDGSLTLAMTDHNESSNYFTNLDEYLKGKSLARIVWPPATLFSRMSTDSTAIHTPCNAKWSNPLRFDPNDPDQDKCVHFTAFAKGTVYIIFSSIPTAKETWYYIEISKYGVVIYKGEKMIDFTINQNAVSIGSSNLYQSYYACLTETPTSTVIEYGKTQGNTAYGDNYLTVIDHANPPIRARFFTFGNGENDAQVMDIQVTPRSGLTQECKGGTAQDASGQLCLRKPCHETCDEREGCRPPAGHTPLPSECYSCKYAKEDGNCVLSCASGFVPNKNKICQRNYDLTFKDSHTLHSTILAPSALSAFTLCLWIKFPTYSSEYLHREYSILRYVYDEIYTDRVFFRLNVKYEVTEKPSFVLQFYHDLRDVANENSDAEMKLEPSRDIDTTKWNTVCITRESKTGQTHLLWYGEETLTGNKHFIPGYTMKKGGEFILGGLAWRLPSDITNYPIDGNLPVSVSQINVWDRKLTNDQISAIFKHEKCDGGAGNILDWEDFKSAVTLSQYIKTEPSTCASGSAMMF